MTMWWSLATSVVSICILTFALYMPRHHRSDLAAAYLVIGLGLAMIVVTLRQATTLGAGFGLGILGVLSVFRLRSVVIDHYDVAYFFATLGIGIIGGLTTDPTWLTPVFCAALLVALFVADHPRVSSANQRQMMLLDRVHTDGPELRSELSTVLSAQIHRVEVREVDLLRQTTLIDVRFRPDNTNRP
jgi:hypothetical protein